MIERLQAGAEILVTLTHHNGLSGRDYTWLDGTELPRDAIDGMLRRKLLVVGQPSLGLGGPPQTLRLRPDFAWPDPKPKRERKPRASRKVAA